MSAKFTNDRGNILISDHVVASIVGVSAMETYGIVGMASKNATDGLFELLKFENLAKGIRVEGDGDKVDIDIHVIIQYGTNIATVSQNLLEKVRFNVETLTGLEVGKLNLFVQGIRISK